MSPGVTGFAATASAAVVLYGASFLLWLSLARFVTSSAEEGAPRVTRSPLIQLRLVAQSLVPALVVCVAVAVRFVDSGTYLDLFGWSLQIGAPVATVVTAFQIWRPRALEHAPRRAGSGLLEALERRNRRIVHFVVGAAVVAGVAGTAWAGTPSWDRAETTPYATYRTSTLSFEYPKTWDIERVDGLSLICVRPDLSSDYQSAIQVVVSRHGGYKRIAKATSIAADFGTSPADTGSRGDNREPVRIPGAVKAVASEYELDMPSPVSQTMAVRNVVALTGDGTVVWLSAVATAGDVERLSKEYDHVIRSLNLTRS